MPRRPLRVLALPGYTQNAHIFAQKIEHLREECGDEVEFVILEQPHVMRMPDLADEVPLPPTTPASAITDNIATEPRAWWTSDSAQGFMTHYHEEVYFGFEESLQYIKDFLDQQTAPFDGIFGFSQGGCMAALLTSVLVRPSLHPIFAQSTTPLHPPFKFAVIVASYVPVPKTPNLDAWFPLGPETPTLTVTGKNDPVIRTERTVELAEQSEDNRLETHSGGHWIPSTPHWLHFFKQWITSFSDDGLQGDVSGPSSPNNSSTNLNEVSPDHHHHYHHHHHAIHPYYLPKIVKAPHSRTSSAGRSRDISPAPGRRQRPISLAHWH